MSLIVLPGIFLAIPSGALMRRVGFRKLGFFSTTLITIGSALTAFSPSFPILLLGRLLIGVGGAFIVTLTPAIISQWFRREELGRAMGIYGINMPIATVAAFTLNNLTLDRGWRYPLFFAVAVAALSIIVTTFLMKEGPLNIMPSTPPRVGETLRKWEVWKTGLAWFFYNATMMSFITWSTRLFEVFRETPPTFGGTAIIAMMLLSIPFTAYFGLLSDIIERKKFIMTVGFSFIALIMLVTPMLPNRWLLFLSILLGIVISTVPPIIMTLPSQILTPSSVSLGFGVFTLCLNLGVTLAPPLIGLIVDATESLTIAFAGMSAFSVVGAIVASSLKMK